MKLDCVPAFTLQPLKREVKVVEADALRTPSFINDVAGGRVELPTIPAVVQRLIAAVSLIGIAALNRLIVTCGVSSSFEAVPGIDLGQFLREAMPAASTVLKLAPRFQADPKKPTSALCCTPRAT